MMYNDWLLYDHPVSYPQLPTELPLECSEEALTPKSLLNESSISHLLMPNAKLAATPQQSTIDGFYSPDVYGFNKSFETEGLGSCLLDASFGSFYDDSWPSTQEDIWQHKQLEVPFSTEAVDVSLFLCESDEEAHNCDTDWLPEGISYDETQGHPIDALLSGSAKSGNFKSKGHQHRIQKKRSRKYEQPYKRTSRTVKGLTMCMRTLLRQLLAGTGWIVDASICRDKAICLIKILIGSELENHISIDLPMGDTSHLPSGWKERHYTAILAKIMTYHLGVAITIGDLEQYITLRRGPYRLSSRFKEALGRKQWPPFMPSEEELRAFGCYRFGEAATRRTESLEALESHQSVMTFQSELPPC